MRSAPVSSTLSLTSEAASTHRFASNDCRPDSIPSRPWKSATTLATCFVDCTTAADVVGCSCKRVLAVAALALARADQFQRHFLRLADVAAPLSRPNLPNLLGAMDDDLIVFHP